MSRRAAPLLALVVVTAIWGYTFVPVQEAVAIYPLFAFVLEGTVRTEFADGREIVLDAGDSAAYVSGESGHRHINLSDKTTRMVVVIRRPRPR